MKLLKNTLQQNKGVNQETGRFELQETGTPAQKGQREGPDNAESPGVLARALQGRVSRKQNFKTDLTSVRTTLQEGCVSQSEAGGLLHTNS